MGDKREEGICAGSRYSRQMVLDEIGRSGQEALSRSTVLAVGCGALGSVQAELLARAGVGRLILVDRDVVELHNLQRQLLFDEQDVRDRLPKAIAAERRLRAVNSEIAIEGVVEDVTALNVLDLMQPADVVIDGTDNLETRYLLNDAAVRCGKPWVYGGVMSTGGTAMAVIPSGGPCLRCIFPEPPDPGLLPTCDTRGVLNTAVAWVAAFQVTEALRILTGDIDRGFKLTAFDIWRCEMQSVEMKRNSSCICCVQKRFEFLERERGSSSTVFCGRNAVQVTPEAGFPPDFTILKKRLEPLGKVSVNGLVLEFTCDEGRLLVFPDGRVLVMGTTDTAEARSFVARYIGS